VYLCGYREHERPSTASICTTPSHTCLITIALSPSIVVRTVLLSLSGLDNRKAQSPRAMRHLVLFFSRFELVKGSERLHGVKAALSIVEHGEPASPSTMTSRARSGVKGEWC
jgi:hypothetical protein